MKALEKDRSRRYETASGLARDIERYLRDEPVEACPPSALYLLRKLAHKHRTPLRLAAAFLALLLVAVIVTTWLAIWATHAEKDTRMALEAAQRERDRAEQAEQQARRDRDAAEAAERKAQKALVETRQAEAKEKDARLQAELVSRYLIDAFQSPDPLKSGYQVKVVDVLKQAVERLNNFQGSTGVKATLLRTFGETYLGLGLPKEAVGVLEKARAARPDSADAETLMVKHDLATAYSNAKQFGKALPLFEETLALRKKLYGADDPSTQKTVNNLARAYQEAFWQGNKKDATLLKKAVPLFEAALAARKKQPGPYNLDTLESMNNLATAYLDLAPPGENPRFNEALQLLEETLRLCKDNLPPDHPHTVKTMTNLAYAYQDANRLDEAIPMYKEAIKWAGAKLGPGHRTTLTTISNLASAYLEQGQFKDAAQVCEEAHPLAVEHLGAKDAVTRQLKKTWDEAKAKR
jgi:hypothetical protein